MNKVLFEKVNCSLSTGPHTIFTNIVHIHPHWHDEIEIIFVCRGDLFVNIQGIQKQIHKGDIALVSSGKEDQMAEYLDEIRKLLLLGINELVKMEKAYTSMIHSHCAHILSLLLRHFLKNDTELGEHDQFSITDQGQQRLKRVFTYINEHYQDNPTLEEIAGIACLSPSYFSRSFYTITGMSYSQYLNIVKISMVQQDLLDSGDSVLDIMLRHGFSNVKTFNRVFKINTVFSPSAYRKYMQGFHDENNWMQTGSEKHDRKYAGGIIPDSRLGSYVNFRNAIEIPDDLFVENNEGQFSITVRKHIHDFEAEVFREDIHHSSEKMMLCIKSDRRAYHFFFRVDDEQLHDCGSAFTAGLSTEGTHTMTFTGVYIGLFCDSGEAAFESFSVNELQ